MSEALVRSIVDANAYMTLATADERGSMGVARLVRDRRLSRVRLGLEPPGSPLAQHREET